MQAYALKKTVEKLGTECSIINYQRENWIADSAAVFKRKFGKLLGEIIIKIYCLQKKKALMKHQDFQNTYLDGGVLVRRGDLQQLLSQHDIFITGSDQVWNQNNAKVDGTYFLDFVDDEARKISYAASFGVDKLTQEQIKNAKHWLSSFNTANISVREQQGAELVSNLIGYRPVVTVDPALLLTQDEWVKIAKPPREYGYIFLYERVDSPTLCEFTKQLSKETRKPIMQCGGYPWRTVGKRLRGLRPDEWLGYIQNADYVVTNSFHGIAFALIYRKPFFVELRKGKHANTNSRLTNILNQLHLNDRVISDEIDIYKRIDYDEIIPILDEKRNESLSWLLKRLNASTGGVKIEDRLIGYE